MPNEILQSMQEFSKFLTQENQRTEKELKDKKVNLSAQRISKAFEGLGPGATAEDLRKLSLQMVDDAAGLDALQENQSLISSAYSTTLNTIDRAKKEKQDAAYTDNLKQFTRNEVNIDNMSAEQAGDFTKMYVGADYKFETTDAKDNTWMIRSSTYGKEISRDFIKNRRQEMNLEISKHARQKAIDESYDKDKLKISGYTVPGPGGMQVPLMYTDKGQFFVNDQTSNQPMPADADYFSKMSTDKETSKKEQIETIDLGMQKVALEFLTKINLPPKKGEKPNDMMAKFLAENQGSEKLGTKMKDLDATAGDWTQLKEWKGLQDQQQAIVNDYSKGASNLDIKTERRASISDTQYNNTNYTIDQMFKNPTGENPFGASYQEGGKSVKYSNLALKKTFKEMIAGETKDFESTPLLKAKLKYSGPTKTAEWQKMTDNDWTKWWGKLDNKSKEYFAVKFKDLLPTSITNYTKKP